jgi:hypothetical protein
MTDQDLDLGGPVPERHGQVAGLPGDPFAGGVRGHTTKPHQATIQLYEEQDVHPRE